MTSRAIAPNCNAEPFQTLVQQITFQLLAPISQALLAKSRPTTSAFCGLAWLELVDLHSHTFVAIVNIHWTFIVQPVLTVRSICGLVDS